MQESNNQAKGEMMNKTYYFCNGSVRGNCGHHHKTVEAAAKCAERDCAGCRAQGGYSDRTVRGSDGTFWGWTRQDDGIEVYSQS